MSFTAKKSLGQNFLQDAQLARWIADQIEPDGAPLVVEVGPGQGALTEHLIGRPRRLLLIEKDNELAADLQEELTESGGAEIWHGDAARFDLRPLFQHGAVKLIGNLPYSAGGVILKQFLTPPTPVTEAVFMLQKEVCERIAAQLDDDAYGALSLHIQHDWNAQILRTVPPNVFKPRPRVDSAVVRLTRKAPGTLPVHDARLFDRLVRTGFAQRRKQLKNLLPEAPGGWAALVAALGCSVSVRAEELSLGKWVQLTRHYENRHEEDRGQRASEIFDVVNERNEVTGQATRGEVHARGLLHRAVHIFVFNKHGELWLQQRSHLKDVHPLLWDSSAAGHLDSGEDYATAAVRELKEELGVEVPGTECLARLPATANNGWEFIELHRAQHHGPMHFAPDEIACGQFFRVEQIESWIAARPEDFAGGFLECFKEWRAAEG